MFFFRNNSPQIPRTLGGIVEALPEVAELFLKLGHDPALSERTAVNLAEMKRLVRAEITDFVAFRIAVRAAAEKADKESAPFEIRDRGLLDAALAAGDDLSAVLAILNRNPVYEQVPFVERVPVLRSGAVIWLTPVEHSCIRKRPSDPVRFEQLAEELEGLYGQAHPQRRDGPRIEVLGAIVRLKRESKREKAYVPTAIQSLESKVEAFETESFRREAKVSVATLSELLTGLEQIRVACAAAEIGPAERTRLRDSAAANADQYLSCAQLHIPRLTHYILEILLTPVLLEMVRRPAFTVKRTTQLIRSEIRAGRFDPPEIAGRIRKLEAQGLYVTSLLFPLLRLHQASPAPRVNRQVTHKLTSLG